MLVVPIVQFAAKSTQKTAMYFSSEMDRKWRPSNKSRNVIGQTLIIHGSGSRAYAAPPGDQRGTTVRVYCIRRRASLVGCSAGGEMGNGMFGRAVRSSTKAHLAPAAVPETTPLMALGHATDFPFENVVFEGGGNKGISYVGAVRVSLLKAPIVILIT